MESIDNAHVRVRGGYWGRVSDLIRNTVIPFQWRALNDEIEGAEKSHCIENFRIAAGEQQGTFYGCVFQDSDVAKWLEAVAYVLMQHPNPALEKVADEAIALIGRAQQADGYLNTYFTVKEPQNRWSNLKDQHELYCAGHLMEAAVAYYQATGKRELLDIMLRMARHIDGVLGPQEGKKRGYPGHPEIEMALMRMYKVTGETFLYDLARFFVDERGAKPDYYDIEGRERGESEANIARAKKHRDYHQSHQPVRAQQTLDGHSVRALYLLSGMIDVARQSGDDTLWQACKRLFDDATQRRMYITGGVGSTHHGEAFTFDYDLPNDTVYAETCASIALIFAAQRMLEADTDGRYADVIERALYNTCMAGISLDGQSFFYVNPLEVTPAGSAQDPGKRHVLPKRPQWFGCACCPPNLARLVGSLGHYAFGADQDGVYIHQYLAADARCTVAGQAVQLRVDTQYPHEGTIRITTSAGAHALRLRIPAWSKTVTLSRNGQQVQPTCRQGYAELSGPWQEGDVVELTLDMTPRRVYAHPLVREDAGKVALQRGPLVYCLEQADNGPHLHLITLPRDAQISAAWQPELLDGVYTLHTKARRLDNVADALYTYDRQLSAGTCELTWIPYYAWTNREPGEMNVWVREA